jgi:peptidoglycan/LPS O-acetylase OafA/YrhL
MHLPQLDGVRGLAILLVMVLHLWRFPEGHELLNRLAGAGWVGVDLFFVLSGFLITRILFRTKTEAGYYRKFYIRRSLRIFPLYYAFLILVIGVLPLVVANDQLLQVRSDAAWYFLYLSNVAIGAGGWAFAVTNITWSLAVEEQFYLIWPSIVRWCTKDRLIKLCVGLIICAPIARAIVFSVSGWTWPYVATPLRADAFAWGAIVALVGHEQLKKYARPVVWGGAAAILALVLSDNFERSSLLVSSVGYSMAGIVFAAIIVSALSTQRSRFENPLLRAFGKLSYAMYLMHFLVMVAVNFVYKGEGSFLGSAAFMAICMLVTYAAALISYHYFEAPILRWKDRLTEPRALTVTT